MNSLGENLPGVYNIVFLHCIVSPLEEPIGPIDPKHECNGTVRRGGPTTLYTPLMQLGSPWVKVKHPLLDFPIRLRSHSRLTTPSPDFL